MGGGGGGGGGGVNNRATCTDENTVPYNKEVDSLKLSTVRPGVAILSLSEHAC